MPLTTIVILSGIVAAFALFGIALAWGEYQTRHLDPNRDGASRAGGEAAAELKKAA